MTTIDLRKLVNDIYEPYLDNDKRYLVLYGGAGSGKSVFAVQKLIFRCLKETGHNFLVIRKVSRTQKESTFALFIKILTDFGILEHCKINRTDYTIGLPFVNSRVIFMGCDDPEKLKSIAGVTGMWIEEATELNFADFEELDRRLRGDTKFYKQIILTFNPISMLHWLKKHFFDTTDKYTLENTSILKTTYKDNRFLDEAYVRKLESYKTVDQFFYNVYSLAEWGILENLVFYNWTVEDLSGIKDEFNKYYYGLDFGYSVDPVAYIKVAVKDDRVYVLDEHYETGLTNDRIAQMLKAKSMNSYIMCDSAEPKSIAELRNYGIEAVGVKKGKDSVNHGIQWLKQKKIVVDNRCMNMVNELQLYKWDENKDRIKDVPIDMYNHLIDALRYSLEELMGLHEIKPPPFNLSSLGL